MDASEIIDYQYVAQHFGFHPKTFCDLVYNVFFENLSESLNQMKQYLVQEFKEVMAPFAIQRATDCILQTLVKQCDKYMDKLEIYLMKNVFTLPCSAVLPEDEIHIIRPCTKEENDNLDKEIENLKRRIVQETVKRDALCKQIKEQEKIQKDLMSVENDLQTLADIASREMIDEKMISEFYSALSDYLTQSKPEEMNIMEE